MKVINPTDSKIEIQFRGVGYSIEANGEAEILDAAALYWKSMIHNFIILEESTVAPVATVPTEVITAEMREAGVDESTQVVSREEVVAELGEEAVKEIETSPKKSKK